ncbi:MAG: hypothetical protein KAT58_11915, partial [candidate division Zixibacteria bacterium]|nr:hypothetical protein [candidate division Zixibacteria bacterium]
MLRFCKCTSLRGALLLLAAALLIPTLAVADHNDIVGNWEGAIHIPGTELEIAIVFALDDEGDITGAIDIPLQGAKDLPLADIKIDGVSITFAMPDVPGDPVFSGIIA